jgi:peptidoglycan/LPS O-acetylase OafA/YrhL
MMLAILGCSQRYLNRSGKFMGYLKSRSFPWYLAHFPIMSFIAYLWMKKFNLPMAFNYVGILILSSAATALFCEALRLTPVLRFLLFGMRTQGKQAGGLPTRGA